MTHFQHIRLINIFSRFPLANQTSSHNFFNYPMTPPPNIDYPSVARDKKTPLQFKTFQKFLKLPYQNHPFSCLIVEDRSLFWQFGGKTLDD
jgi:hypothetical protein